MNQENYNLLETMSKRFRLDNNATNTNTVQNNQQRTASITNKPINELLELKTLLSNYGVKLN